MTPAEALAQHKRFLAEYGEDIVLRRYSGVAPSRTAVNTTTRARVMDYKQAELVGSIVQGDVRVIALAETLADLLPITTNDYLVVRGRELAVQAVDDNTRRIAGVLIALEIQARG